jgi:hypothetical protein
LKNTIEVSLTVVLNATKEAYKASRPQRVSEFLKNYFINELCDNDFDAKFEKENCCLNTLTIPTNVGDFLGCNVSTNTVAFSGLLFVKHSSEDKVKTSIIETLDAFEESKFADIEAVHISISNKENENVTTVTNYSEAYAELVDFGGLDF